MRSPRRLASVIATAGVLAIATGAAAGTSTDSGTIHTGVGSEAEAEALPCPGESVGEAGRTGPVVCLDRKAASWTLTSEASGECTQGPAGWQGECIRAIDDGEVVRVWGTRGIPPTSFTITWHEPERTTSGSTTRTDAPASDDGDDPDGATPDEKPPVVADAPARTSSSSSTTRMATTRRAPTSSGGLAAGTGTPDTTGPSDPATPEVATPSPSPDPLAGSHDAAGRMPPRAYQPPIGPEPSPIRTGGLATAGLLALAAGGWALRAELRDGVS